MDFRILIAVVAALFSVFGFYCAVRTIGEMLFPARRLSVAVEVRDKRDVEDLDMLLDEAVKASLGGGARLVVLMSVELMDGTVGFGDELSDYYADLLDRFGAECYLIEP